MLSLLNNATYPRLFSAQVVVLGTGLATVALGFLAHRLGDASAGEILGIALAIGADKLSDFGPERPLSY